MQWSETLVNVKCGSYEWAILVRTNTMNSRLLYPFTGELNRKARTFYGPSPTSPNYHYWLRLQKEDLRMAEHHSRAAEWHVAQVLLGSSCSI
jgi:hypothetical protein